MLCPGTMVRIGNSRGACCTRSDSRSCLRPKSTSRPASASQSRKARTPDALVENAAPRCTTRNARPRSCRISIRMNAVTAQSPRHRVRVATRVERKEYAAYQPEIDIQRPRGRRRGIVRGNATTDTRADALHPPRRGDRLIIVIGAWFIEEACSQVARGIRGRGPETGYGSSRTPTRPTRLVPTVKQHPRSPHLPQCCASSHRVSHHGDAEAAAGPPRPCALGHQIGVDESVQDIVARELNLPTRVLKIDDRWLASTRTTRTRP